MAIHGVSLSVAEGSITSVLGPMVLVDDGAQDN